MWTRAKRVLAARRNPGYGGTFPMDTLLTFAEARVLGCLLEKETTTPDNYPLSLAAVVTACNQTSSREPVVSFSEADAEEALAGLRRKKLAAMLHLAGSRVPKFRHMAGDYFPGLQRSEFALLTVLLLRGAQTVAELRARTERLHAFPDTESVESAIRRLLDWQDGPLVEWLPPGGGRRAPTCVPLLFPLPAAAGPSAAPAPPAASAPAVAVADWRTSMELEIATLRSRLDALESALGVPPPPDSGQA